MDPTLAIISDQKPEPYHKHSEPVVDIELIKDIRVSSVDSLPAVYTDLKLYSQLQDLKAEYRKDPNYEWIKLRLNPFEEIGRSIFSNRAAVKLANVDAIFNFTGHQYGLLSYQTPGKFYFCDIAAGPGAFTQYLQWRRPEAFGFGITLPGPLDWDFTIIDADEFKAFYGSDNSGNLYTQWENFVTYVRETQADGVDLVTGDGGFNVEDEEDPLKRELLSSRLILTQMATALGTVKEGGTFVLKLFETVNEMSAQLLYLTNMAFESITIFKPISSRPANTERYLVCEKARSFAQREPILQLFREANQKYSEGNVVNLVSEIPESFKLWLTESNLQSLKRQTKYAKKLVDYLHKKPQPQERYDLSRALIVWNLPDNK